MRGRSERRAAETFEMIPDIEGTERNAERAGQGSHALLPAWLFPILSRDDFVVLLSQVAPLPAQDGKGLQGHSPHHVVGEDPVGAPLATCLVSLSG